MVVYVDDMFLIPMGRFGRMKMSHMIADTEEELHKMADAIGLKRRWYQGDHYDVSMVMRGKAIELGAVAVTMRTVAYMAMNKKMGYPMGTPETAEMIANARRADAKKQKELENGNIHKSD